MATAAVQPTTNATLLSAPAAKSPVDEAKLTSERFLKLLVAQMQNQDPLSPMDNAQVTSQMAQINTVSGIEKLNTTVQQLSSQFTQLQTLQGAALVGRDVVVAGNRLDIAPGDATVPAVGQGGFELQAPADAVKVEILAPSGAVVDTLNLGAASAGLHSFDWPAGAATNAAGYAFRVTATAGGVALPSTALMRDRVTAVATAAGGMQLELAFSGPVPWASVKAFN